MQLLRAHRDDPKLFQLDRMIGNRGDVYRGSGLIYFDGEDLNCKESLSGEGHVLWPAINRLEESWDELCRLFEKEQTAVGVGV